MSVGAGPAAATELVPVRLPMEGGQYEAVVVLERGDGLAGLGEAPVVPGRTGSLRSLLAEMRQGARGERLSAPARAALETARLDLEARRRAVPLAALLGGVRRARIECSALLTGRRPDLAAREAERKAALGYTCIKLKAADGGGPLDRERLGAVRWAAGPGCRLRLDFNGRLPSDHRPGLGHLAAFAVELFEQPLPAAAPATEWAALAAESPAALAADESLANPELTRALAAAGVVLAPKLGAVGGPLALARLATLTDRPVTIGSCFETSIGLAVALHVACALDREPLACGLATHTLLDADLAHGLRRAGPWLGLPDAPGLGVELDRRALDAYRVDA